MSMRTPPFVTHALFTPVTVMPLHLRLFCGSPVRQERKGKVESPRLRLLSESPRQALQPSKGSAPNQGPTMGGPLHPIGILSRRIWRRIWRKRQLRNGLCFLGARPVRSAGGANWGGWRRAQRRAGVVGGLFGDMGRRQARGDLFAPRAGRRCGGGKGVAQGSQAVRRRQRRFSCLPVAIHAAAVASMTLSAGPTRKAILRRLRTKGRSRPWARSRS